MSWVSLHSQELLSKGKHFIKSLSYLGKLQLSNTGPSSLAVCPKEREQSLRNTCAGHSRGSLACGGITCTTAEGAKRNSTRGKGLGKQRQKVGEGHQRRCRERKPVAPLPTAGIQQSPAPNQTDIKAHRINLYTSVAIT